MKTTQKGNKVHLACTVCQTRNYATFKNQKSSLERLALRKYCPHCVTHTLHQETR